MEERKWEEMNADCLANIFGRVELKSRVITLPLVCKPWYQALQNPLCWQCLFFPPMYFRPTDQLIKFVVDRSQRRATFLALPYYCHQEVLVYVSEELPGLEALVLSSYVCVEHGDIIPSLIKKWKNLEGLMLGNLTFVEEILEIIHFHLPKFTLLCFEDCDVDGEVASAIVLHVPKLNLWSMNGARLKKDNLLLIMRGCKELELLHVRNCIGFDEGDEEILRLSSGIRNFGLMVQKKWTSLIK